MKIFIPILFLAILFSCNSNNKEEPSNVLIEEFKDKAVSSDNQIASIKFLPPKIEEDEQVESTSDVSKNENATNKASKNVKKIIKNGSISIKTNDIDASKKNIDTLLKKLNGYYEREDLQNNEQIISYDLKIRVSAGNFEKLVLYLEKGKDEIRSKSIYAEDITEEYVDIETRLVNKRQYLKRYQELLSKATTIKDILAIEENIRTIQEEIESKVGRLNYLSDQVTFSTLTIYLYREKEFIYQPQTQDNFIERVKKSLNNGWASVIDFTLWLITIWPYIIVLLIVYMLIKRFIKKRKMKQTK